MTKAVRIHNYGGPEALHIAYSAAQARHLIACLMAEEMGAALRGAGPSVCLPASGVDAVEAAHGAQGFRAALEIHCVGA